jgi:hypothetical protein
MFHSYFASLSSYDLSSELFIYDVVTLVSSVKWFMGSAFQTKHTFLQLFTNILIIIDTLHRTNFKKYILLHVSRYHMCVTKCCGGFPELCQFNGTCTWIIRI